MATKAFEPAQTRNWSTTELGNLVGRLVAVRVRGGRYRGVVTEAGIGRFGQAFVGFDDGSSVEWSRESEPASVFVHEGGA